MKIYHKKLFVSGVFMAALATVNLIAEIVNQTVDLNGTLLIGALYLFGLGAILRSLSKKCAKEDKLEARDERNQLIGLKSKSKAFQLAQIFSVLLLLAMLVMGKVSGNESFIAMGVGLAFAVATSMFAELFTFMYYEERN